MGRSMTLLSLDRTEGGQLWPFSTCLYCSIFLATLIEVECCVCRHVFLNKDKNINMFEVVSGIPVQHMLRGLLPCCVVQAVIRDQPCSNRKLFIYQKRSFSKETDPLKRC